MRRATLLHGLLLALYSTVGGLARKSGTREVDCMQCEDVTIKIGKREWRVKGTDTEEDILFEIMKSLCYDSPFSDVAVPLVPARAKDILIYAKEMERVIEEEGWTLEDLLENYMNDSKDAE
jgi:hypothetical protein